MNTTTNISRSATWAQMIEDICQGNAVAKAFLNAWCVFCHLLDDLADRDNPVNDEAMVHGMMMMLMQVSRNEFYQANRGQFESLILASAMAWLDANRTKGTPQSVVLKEYYFEVYFHAALVLGGWARAREITAKYREYDFPTD